MVEKLITKAFQLGLGVLDLTREQAEKLVKEVTKNSEVHKKEGRKMVDKMMKDAEKAKMNLEKKIEFHVKKVIEKTEFATKRDIEILEKKLSGTSLAKKQKARKSNLKKK